MPETSIVIKSEDRYSDSVKKMAQVSKSFSKDAEEMQGTLDRLNKNRYSLKLDADKALKELKAMEKQFAATGEEADGLKAELAQANYDNIRRNLSLVTKEARQVEKQMESTAGTFRKTENAMSGGGGMAGVVTAMAASGMGQMVGQLAQQSANALVASAFGSRAGSLFSSTLSSAASGAAIGTMALGAGTGTAIGALAGAGIGAATGLLENLQAEDDAFRTYYQEQYQNALAARASELSGGSATAGGRETAMVSFSTLLGSEEKAAGFLNEVKTLANTTPFLYDDLTGLSKTLLSYGTAPEGLIGMLTNVGDVGAALGMSNADISMVSTALGRMQSTDKASLEYMNLLTERGVGAIDWLAGRDQISTAEVYDRISKGLYSGKETAAFLSEEFARRYGGSMARQSETYEGKTSTLQGWTDELENAMGAAYNASALQGMNADIEAYTGELGEAMMSMNAAIGEGKGIAENLDRQYQREAMSALLLGEQTTVYDEETAKTLQEKHKQYTALMEKYQTASETDKAVIAAEIEALKGEAEALAESSYNASETGIALRDTELELIEAIRENTAALSSSAWNKGFLVSEEGSKGLASNYQLGNGFRGSSKTGSKVVWGVDLSGYAYGLDRVPYDNFPAMLHQGERVLTAAQARQEDRGAAGVVVQITGPVTVREEADLWRLAELVSAEIQRAAILAAP